MQRALRALDQYTILAKDGQIGSVHDFYFDDQYWTIRYLVIRTGSWVSRKEILISPLVTGSPNWEEKTLPVDLTKEQVTNSPEAELDLPVSRQYEAELATYYDWPTYWLAGSREETIALSSRMARHVEQGQSELKGDPNLRSSSEVCGYSISASDGKIGHVEDLIVEDETWVIRYMVVDTKDWLPGKKVLIPPAWLVDIAWKDKKVEVDLSREEVSNSPEYDSHAPVNRKYEEQLYDYYGRPAYWATALSPD